MQKGLSIEQLDGIRQDTNKLVPAYYLTQFDALEALDNGVGNCFSKAMVACGIIVLKYAVEPSIVYKKSIHGSKDTAIDKPTDSKTGKKIAHVVVAVPGSNPTTDKSIPGLNFGVAVSQGVKFTQTDAGEILQDYNEPGEFVRVNETGTVIATEIATERGMFGDRWRDIAPDYLQALDRPDLDIDLLIGKLKESYPDDQVAA
ncbi:hypothetical protein HY003_02695 [Candidatus Saccharibacteria bacterium]|nr:hypothetical protein [Candidatus Saccharibacteria bacterium]